MTTNANGASTTTKKASSSSSREGVRWDAVVIGSGFAVAVYRVALSFDFVKNFSYPVALVDTHPFSFPAVFIGLYLLWVHVFDPWYRTNLKVDAKFDAFLVTLLRGWNFFLAALSIVMLAGIGIPVAQHVLFQERSFHAFICDPNSSRWAGAPYFWVWIFALSKYAELIDTVFLTLRDKPISLLHWYHHASVLLYTWVAMHYRFDVGFIFAVVNCLVHSAMYWYYYRRACGVKLSYDRLITQIQISQMVLGVFATAAWTYYHLSGSSCDCDNTLAVLPAALLMYGSYLYLFYRFYVDRYETDPKRPISSSSNSKEE